jgi:hypothetical protein
VYHVCKQLCLPFSIERLNQRRLSAVDSMEIDSLTPAMRSEPSAPA